MFDGRGADRQIVKRDLVSGVMVAGTLSMQGIVQSQLDRGVGGIFANYGFMIVPVALYIIAAQQDAHGAHAGSPVPRDYSQLIS